MSVQLQLDSHSSIVREPTISDAISTFLEIELVIASPQTVKWYERRLSLFKKAIGDKVISEIGEEDLWNWYKDLRIRVKQGAGRIPGEISINTQHGYIRAVRRLFKWLYDRNILAKNLARDLKLPKLPKNGKKGISEKDVQVLLLATKVNKRDYALLRFIESTGCRRGGVADLRMSDLSLDADEPFCRRATIREKGGKERSVFMSVDALQAMKAWLAERNSCSDYVFINSKFPNRGLVPYSVSEIITRYKKQAGITGKVSPHQWRHRLGRKLTQAGMPLGLVSQVLGHSSVVVTNDFYGIFAVNELQKAMDKYYTPPKISE
jgi:site-specific recombinase XerD